MATNRNELKIYGATGHVIYPKLSCKQLQQNKAVKHAVRQSGRQQKEVLPLAHIKLYEDKQNEDKQNIHILPLFQNI